MLTAPTASARAVAKTAPASTSARRLTARRAIASARVSVPARPAPASARGRSVAARAAAVDYVSVTVGPTGRKRRVIRPIEPAAPAPDAVAAPAPDFADCPSDGCSVENASPDADHPSADRGAASDPSSSEEARAQLREQLAALRAAAAPDVRRKRRVLKPLSKEPAAAPEAWDMVELDEGNCPSDGCSLEGAAPSKRDDAKAGARDLDGRDARAKRGYQSAKHSSEDARERVSLQVERLREQRARDAAAAAAAARRSAVAVDENATATEEEKAMAKAQKEAFYFTVAGLASYAATRPDAPAFAAATGSATIDPFFNFNPVCPASDGVFRVGQRAALGLAGADNIENYRPLINDVLIRVRTELCVLESFSRETALPFIREKGIGWVLPLHETSETYLAGVVFMVGANFILLGSTKVVAILAIYHDLSLGLLARGAGSLLGMATPEADAEKREREFNALMEAQMEEVKALMMDGSLDRETREKRTAEVNARYSKKMEETKEAADVRLADEDASALAKVRAGAGAAAIPLRLYGRASGVLRQGLETFDTFCSRYFVAFTVTYIIIKTAHYVFFPNIFD